MNKQWILSTLILLGALFAFPLFTNAQSNECVSDPQVYDIPGTYTFTVPPGVTSINVVTVGGGGGGGGGSDGWGGGAGGGCGGSVNGNTISVTPGQQISLTVGAGGNGGTDGTNGSPGSSSSFGSFSAAGGSYGGTGYYGDPPNTRYGPPGGKGVGSGGGGGGNPYCDGSWCFLAKSVSGGSAGSQPDESLSTQAGWANFDGYFPPTGYCTGSGWSVSTTTLNTLITMDSSSPGAGGWAPNSDAYCGGGGGGGLVISGYSAGGGSGSVAYYNGDAGTISSSLYFKTAASDGVGPSCSLNGGAGFGAGGGGSYGDTGPTYSLGGAGAPGVVYIEWNGGTQTSCGLSCSISFAQNPLTSSSTTMSWTSQDASLFYINNVGYVGTSGSTQVYAPGDYSGYVSDSSGDTASCSATLGGTAGECAQTAETCEADGNLENACGQVTSCQYGCSMETNQCNNSCQPTNVCNASNTAVVNSCTGAVTDNCATSGETCLDGECVAPAIGFIEFGGILYDGTAFTATGHLQVIPALLQSGATARVYWDVANATSCTVTGTNGDGLKGSATGLWDTLFSGASGTSTSPITGQTTYTLSCSALPGAVTSSISESVTVNVAPSYEEL